jgi:hypothetical protein
MLEGHLVEFSDEDLARFLLEISLARSVDFQPSPKVDRLLSYAKGIGIDTVRIERAVNAGYVEIDKKRKAKDKKKKPSSKPDKKKAPAGQHACEVCGCTEHNACPGGCVWDPAFMLKKRYVCTNCSDEAGVA